MRANTAGRHPAPHEGAKRTPERLLALTRPLAAHPRVLAWQAVGGPAVRAHLTDFLCEREDQGQTDSCTVHTYSQLTYAVCGARGPKLAAPPSPDALYRLSGAIARADAQPVGPLSPLRDEGRYLTAVIQAGMLGVVPMARRSPDGRFSDLWSPGDVADVPGAPPANNTAEPAALDLEAASPELLQRCHTVDPVDPTFDGIATAAIDAGIGLYVGFDCDSAYQNLGPNDVAKPVNPSDPNHGGHSVGLIDYRINPQTGEYEYLTLNPWGPHFAANGMVWASSAWRKSLWEVWAIDVSYPEVA